METATIKAGKNTGGHLEALQSYGYDAQKDDDKIVVNCSGFVDGPIDARTEEKLLDAVEGLVKNNKLFTYKTKFLIINKNDEEAEVQGIAACGKLGELSCFIAKPTKGSVASKGPKLDALKARLARKS